MISSLYRFNSRVVVHRSRVDFVLKATPLHNKGLPETRQAVNCLNCIVATLCLQGHPCSEE